MSPVGARYGNEIHEVVPPTAPSEYRHDASSAQTSVGHTLEDGRVLSPSLSVPVCSSPTGPLRGAAGRAAPDVALAFLVIATSPASASTAPACEMRTRREN